MEKMLDIPDNKTYIVYLSGGLDSALVLFLIGTYLPNSDLVLVTATHNHMSHYNKPYVIDIVSWFTTRFDNRIVDHKFINYTDRIDSQARKQSDFDDTVREYYADGRFVGMTLNPIGIEDLMTDDSRDKRRDVKNGWKKDMTKYFGKEFMSYQPLNDIDKKAVASLYAQYDLASLAEITISCESLIEPKPCKTCWWCREKYWGFGHY